MMLSNVLVVGVLVLLVVALIMLGSILSATKSSKPQAVVQNPPEQLLHPPIAPPYVEAGIPAEVVAAISAAVACMQEGSYTISSVSTMAKAAKGRRAWGQAGVAAATSPF